MTRRLILMTVLVALLVSSPTQAKPAHKKALAEFFGPSFAAVLNDCRTCHLPDKPGEEASPSEKPHNPFGARLAAVRAELQKAGKTTDIASRLLAIADEDSDGDGVPNLLELLSGHRPGDRADKPTAAEIAAARKQLPEFLATRKKNSWSPFEPVQRPPVPTAKNTAWVRNAVDAFLAAEHEKHGLKPRPEAPRHVLLRRVYLDLIGLPATREELYAFLADTASDAYEKLVDRLLQSPRYGERWGRHWMDVWRYSDWSGYGDEVRDSHRHIWQWRDWIIASLNADKGYDRMIQEMLAGDELAPTDPDTLRATGFLVRNWYKFNREVWLDHTVEHTAKAFLGVTLNCARCHDHFYDAISQKEYYQFRAFFATHDVRTDRVPGQADVVKAGVPRVYDAHLTAPTYLFIRGEERNPDKSKVLTPAVPLLLGGPPIRIEPVQLPLLAYVPDKRDFVVQETLAASKQALAKAEADLRAAGLRLKSIEDARTTVATAERTAWAKLFELRLKISADAGIKASLPELKEGLAEAGKKSEELAKAEQTVASAREDVRLAEMNVPLAEANHAALMAMLTVENLEDDSGKPRDADVWTKAALEASAAQRRQRVLQTQRDRFAAELTVKRAKTPAERTVAQTKLAESEKQFAKAQQNAQQPPTTKYSKRDVKTFPSTSSGRRLALARWMSDKQNPLTARVAVNHIWLRHFGKPLVPSMFDFGRNGQPPSHAALLDWLAAEFMDRNWSMKELHRLLVTSSAYRMDSTPEELATALDPDNRYLWRMNARRAEAEVVRDSVLHVAGNLDLKMGGPDLDQNLGLTTTRRSVYYRHAHEKYMPFLTIFDGAGVSECYQRVESIVPQQALALANSSLVLAQARLLARRLTREAGATASSDDAFIHVAFEELLSRPPTSEEGVACQRFLAEQTLRLGEKGNLTASTGAASAVAPSIEPHLRAREGLVQVLLNHHEFVTVR